MAPTKSLDAILPRNREHVWDIRAEGSKPPVSTMQAIEEDEMASCSSKLISPLLAPISTREGEVESPHRHVPDVRMVKHVCSICCLGERA
jgi:hypothetical protein